MANYYEEKLAAEKLKSCYELASQRVRQYLDAEIDFVRKKIDPGASVLELGCGYGRVLKALAGTKTRLWGIDNSFTSISTAKNWLGDLTGIRLAVMNAEHLAFRDNHFDFVVCIQNGLSAFHVEMQALAKEALRVTKVGGRALFSSYSERFWEHRLEWFEKQSAYGLIGEIDHRATGNGKIVCRDGFIATTVLPEEFKLLARSCGVQQTLTEVDGSSLFCEMVKQSRFERPT